MDKKDDANEQGSSNHDHLPRIGRRFPVKRATDEEAGEHQKPHADNIVEYREDRINKPKGRE